VNVAKTGGLKIATVASAEKRPKIADGVVAEAKQFWFTLRAAVDLVWSFIRMLLPGQRQ